jgi:hypothetical protein
MTISNVSITKKFYPVKRTIWDQVWSGQRTLWDVEFTLDGEVQHALFTTEDEARRYATTRLGYTG